MIWDADVVDQQRNFCYWVWSIEQIFTSIENKPDIFSWNTDPTFKKNNDQMEFTKVNQFTNEIKRQILTKSIKIQHIF